MLAFIPEKIFCEDQVNRLVILWRDGHTCSYDLLTLRRNCPCASCRGGHDAQAVRTTDHITQIKLLAWNKVGRYALQILWSDNHDTGIYTYDALRKVCEEEKLYAQEDSNPRPLDP